METSDDPNVLNALVFGPFDPSKGGGVIGALKRKAPKPPETVTAVPEEQISETARKKRRRQASLLTSGFTPPKLGLPFLLGVGT